MPEILDRTEATLQSLKELLPGFPIASTEATDSSPTSSVLCRRATCPGIERRLAEILCNDNDADRADEVGFGWSDGSPGCFGQVFRRGTGRDKAADFPSVNQSARDAAKNSRLASDDTAAYLAGHSRFA